MDERGFAPREGGPFLKSNRSTQARSCGPTWRDIAYILVQHYWKAYILSFVHLPPIAIFVINPELSVEGHNLKFKFSELQAFISRRLIGLMRAIYRSNIFDTLLLKNM